MCNSTKTTFDRIKELCTKRNISIAKLAAELGVSKSTFSWIKNHPEKNISLNTAQKIADYFDVPVDYLSTGGNSNSAYQFTDDDIKLALFGGDGDVTDEMWDEALFAIDLIKQRHKNKKKKE